MKDNNIDIFEMSNKQPLGGVGADNFFINENVEERFASLPFQENQRHLNDYDYNLIKEDAYKDIDDEALKLEYKIAKIEEQIKFVKSEIETARQIKDIYKEKELINKLSILNHDFAMLTKLYKDKVVSAKISGSISGLYNKTVASNVNVLIILFGKIYEKIISILPKKFAYIIRVKKSLNVLKNINKSVDGLVSMTIPYGENIDKYNSLSQYIIKANSIHAEIAKYIK